MKTAAAYVREAAPLDKRRIIGVSGAGLVFERRVIPRTLVFVFENGAERKAAGSAVLQSRQEARSIAFGAGRGEAVRLCAAAFQKCLQFREVDSLPGGEAVHEDAHGLSVRLPEH